MGETRFIGEVGDARVSLHKAGIRLGCIIELNSGKVGEDVGVQNEGDAPFTWVLRAILLCPCNVRVVSRVMVHLAQPKPQSMDVDQ